jgi:hypothetical protein
MLGGRPNPVGESKPHHVLTDVYESMSDGGAQPFRPKKKPTLKETMIDVG